MLAWWKGPFLVLLTGVFIFTYIHDGPPYWDWADLLDAQWHHEKIEALLAIVAFIIVMIPPRN